MLISTEILNGAKISEEEYDFEPIFQYVDEYIQEADYAVINLETSLAGAAVEYCGFPKFNTPECIIDTAKEAGFDMFLTASNHSYDWGMMLCVIELMFWKSITWIMWELARIPVNHCIKL